MKITTKSRLFFEAILLTLLISGCSLPVTGTRKDQSFTDYDVSKIDANSLYYIHKNSQTNNGIFGNSNWTEQYDGLEAKIIDNDLAFEQWPQYGDALVDTHGQVIKLSTQTTTTVFSDKNNKNVRSGNSS